MKLFLLAFLCASTLGAAHAANGIDQVLDKVDQKLNQNEASQVTGATTSREDMYARENKLWTAVVSAYDLLKKFSVSERYFFMYQAMQANSLGYPQKVQVLQAWIKKENARIIAENLYPGFYTKWKVHVAEISSALNEMAKPQPEFNSLEAAKAMRRLDDAFLKELKSDLKEINMAKAPAIQVAPVQVDQPQIVTEEAPTNYFALLAISLSCLAMGLFIGRKRKTKIITKIKVVPQVMPEITSQELTAAEPLVPALGVNLEQACKDILKNNSHLLEVANLTIHPTNRSPFKNTVHAPSEKVAEALNWLLKGTIAVANTQASKVSSMEWNCKEAAGRVSLEFILHGIECNQKSLYLNALVEGDSSAPAHFGRSEMALEGHLPAVQFKSGNNRTTVSLGLDSLNSSLNH